MLIYTLLGEKAQDEFTRSWGIGYALDNASEWQDVALTALKVALLMVVLDALRLTKNAAWFEEHGARARGGGRSAEAPASQLHSRTDDACMPRSSPQSTLCPCRRRCSTAWRAAGGRKRALS